MIGPQPGQVSPTEWMRIFAMRVAVRHPGVPAEDAVALAIDQFRCCGTLAPEIAAERLEQAPHALPIRTAR